LGVRRRDFIALLGGAVAAWPLAARAQQPAKKIPVVGVLWHAGNAEEEAVYLNVLRKAFSDLGYTEGKNIVLDHRFPNEQPERFKALARGLVDAKVDAIITVTALGAIELKKITGSVPIVFVLVPDPVGFGLVESLARPGGNLTGLANISIDLSGKRLELLREAVPHMSRVVLLLDGADPFKELTIKAHQAAAAALNITLSSVEVAAADDIEPAFAKCVADGAQGVVWSSGGLFFARRARFGAAAMAHRLPVIVSVAEEVPDGPLMSYGQDVPDYFRRAAGYMDRILKGAKPSDLPVQQPTRLKLVINLRTAKALGLTMPPTLLTTADEVIE
jgi:putative tryptophan/tyrosine transport system substrate-binding protein